MSPLFVARCSLPLVALVALATSRLPAQVAVAPDGGSATAPQNSTGNIAYFSVFNESENGEWFSFSCSTGGQVTSCTAQGSEFIGPFEGAQIWVSFNTGAAGSGTVTLTANTSMSWDDGWYNVTVEAPTGFPVVQSWPYYPEKRDYGRCAVPGCFALIYAQSTVPYFSLDTPRHLTLVYNGDRVNPWPFVHVDAKKDPNHSENPGRFEFRVRKAGGALVTFRNGEQTLNFQHVDDGAYHRLGGQFDAAANGYTTNGVYPIDVIVRAVYSGSVKETVVSTVLVLVNDAGSAIGRGWTIAEVPRLYTQGDGSALITEGGGSSVYFKKFGSTFLSPPGEFSVVTKPFAEWIRAYPDSTKMEFNGSGLVTRIVDRFGNATTFEYDGSNRLWRVTDPAGYTITLAYDGNGHLQSITDHFSRVTGVTVQSDKRLTAITDPDNVSTTFGYDGSLRLSTVTERRGYTTTFGYDPDSWQLASVTSPAVYVFDVGERSLVTTYASWDKVGVPYSGTGTPVPPARWDTISGRVTDPGTHVTRYSKVNAVRQAQETYLPLGLQINATLTSGFQLQQLTQPVGAINNITYDGNGLPTWMEPSGAPGTNIHYAGWAQPDSIWGTGQPRRRMWIGTNGRVDSVETGSAGSATRMRYKYDGRGRITAVRDPLQHKVDSADYGGTNGNTWKVIRVGRTTTFGYDTYGRVTSVAQDGLPTRTMQYDLMNRVTHVYDGVNPNPTRYTHDANFGSETKDSVIDPKGQAYVTTYDRLGRVKTRQHPSGHVVASYEYGWDSEVRRVWNARGQNTDGWYDALHRLIRRSSSAQTDSLQYSADHKVVTAFGPASTDWTYLNVRGVPDSVKSRLGSWDYWRRYAYASAGRLDSVWGSGAPAGFKSRKYGYNTATGALTSIKLSGAQSTFSLNSDLMPSTVTFPGGDQVSRGFTGTHREMAISTSASYDGDVQRKMTLDVPGRLWRNLLEIGQAGHLYGYDGLGRVKADTSVEGANYPLCDGAEGPDTEKDGAVCRYNFWDYWWVTGVASFQYDAVGNRTDNGGGYNPGNRITAFAGCTYSTDNDGNVTQRACPGETVTMAWSSDNRPTQFVVNGTTIDLKYDPAGRLVQRNVNGSPQAYFLWNGETLFAELDAAGEKRAEYSYYPGLDNLHALIIGSTAYYAHQDGLGNVVALSGTDQALKRAYEYDTWGQSLGGWDPAGLADGDRARFKGALWMGPELDVYYMRNRWYEPKTGRFLSEDPIGLDGGINLYAFAADDPVNARDPLGLRKCWWVQVQTGEWVDGELIIKASGFYVCDSSGGGDLGLWNSFFARNPSFAASSRAYHSWVRGAQRELEVRHSEFVCRVDRGLALAGSIGSDVTLGFAYGTGAGLVARGALLYAEGYAMSSGLILTWTARSAGATGAMEMLHGRASMALGAGLLSAESQVVPEHAGVSAIPGMNTVNFFRNGGFGGC